MQDRRFRRHGPGDNGTTGHPPAPDLDRELLEACRDAVDRVLAGLPAWDRRVVEDREDELVAATHRETRAALEQLVGALRPVA